MTCTVHESGLHGVIILAESCAMFSLVIMQGSRYITPLWFILRRGLYLPPGPSCPAEQNNTLPGVWDIVSRTRKMKPLGQLMETPFTSRTQGCGLVATTLTVLQHSFWQVKVVEDVSLLWVWAKTQVSVVQPRLLDGKWLLFCLQRGLPVTLGLVASVKAACSTDALSSSLSDMQELSAEPGLSEALQRKPTAAKSRQMQRHKPSNSSESPSSSLVSPFCVPLALLAWHCPIPVLAGLLHLACW